MMYCPLQKLNKAAKGYEHEYIPQKKKKERKKQKNQKLPAREKDSSIPMTWR
jgi:hypothetical protein